MQWIRTASLRYAVSGRRKKIHFAGLSSLGIAAGFVAVIVIIGIMNGLQQGYLRDIIETDSYHVRITPSPDDDVTLLLEAASEHPQVLYAFAFYELQGIIRSVSGDSEPVLLKGVPRDYFSRDAGFAAEVQMVTGRFEPETADTVIIGSSLSLAAGMGRGSEGELLLLGEGRTVNLVPLQLPVTISGIYASGYPEIDSHISFVSFDLLSKVLPRSQPRIGVKLTSPERADAFAEFARQLPGAAAAETWKERNQSLYSALMLEKYSMMVILFLIFIVVAYNIKNSLERLIFLHRHDIGVLAAVGARKASILTVFLLQGFYVALVGSVIGIGADLLAASRINAVLGFFGSIYTALTGAYVPFFSYTFPVDVVPGEVALTAAAVMLLSLAASWLAVRKILRYDPVRILHYE